MRIVALYYFMYTELRGTCTEYSTSGAPAESVAYPLFLLCTAWRNSLNAPIPSGESKLSPCAKIRRAALICIISNQLAVRTLPNPDSGFEVS